MVAHYPLQEARTESDRAVLREEKPLFAYQQQQGFELAQFVGQLGLQSEEVEMQRANPDVAVSSLLRFVVTRRSDSIGTRRIFRGSDESSYFEAERDAS